MVAERAPATGTPIPTSPTSRPQAAVVPALTLDHYKRVFAQRVADASPEIFHDPLPTVLKSIVVLDVTIDGEGRLSRVFVQRSNGYKALESAALDSVRRSAPFAAPVRPLRRRDGSVNFLETFLFRDDGRFQILSLVAANPP